MKTPKPFRFRRRSSVRGIARELLRCFEDRSRHTKGWLATDAAGAPCDPREPHAARWCVDGAAIACAGHDTAPRDRFRYAFIHSAGVAYPWEVNDGGHGSPHGSGLRAVRRVLRKLAKP
jgi:hypothetical protein